MTGIKVALKADSGNFLARCNNCISNAAYPDAAFVHVSEGELINSPWAHFNLEQLDNGKYTLKADSGNYVARCNNCIPNAAYPDATFVHVSEQDVKDGASWAQFTLERLDNGKYTLLSDNGNYVARCNRCIPDAAYPDAAFIHVSKGELLNSPWAQWDIIILP